MNGVITMSKFGRLGRFGNQVFQYMFLADYANRNNLELQLPPWVGNQLFTKQFKMVSAHRLPVRKELDETPGGTGIFPAERRQGIVHRNFDYEGYAQYYTGHYDCESKKYIKSLFEFQPEIVQRMAEPLAKLQGSGTAVTGVHLRRGDYGRGMFYITPVAWYLEVLEFLWSNLPNPVLFVSTESPELVREFARFNPQTAESLGVDLRAKPLLNYNYLSHDLKQKDPRQLDWVPDWYLLRYCDKLLIPNSTFSFSAAMLRLGRSNGSDYQSTLRTQPVSIRQFHMINPWSAQPLSYDKVEDYPELCAQGAKIDSNPYWK